MPTGDGNAMTACTVLQAQNQPLVSGRDRTALP